MKERLLQLADYLQISIRKLEEESGLKRGNISNISEKGSIGADKLSKIIDKYPCISPEWLLTGRGQMTKTNSATFTTHTASHSTQPTDSEHKYTNNNSYTQEKTNLIPLVNTEAVAGFGSGTFSIEKQDIQALYNVPDFNGIDFMLRVKGNSMYPKYSSGDVIACRILRQSNFIEWNKPHLIATAEHGLIVKRIRKSDLPDAIQAVSDNEKYDPFDIPMNEITGIAIIIGVIRLE